MVVESPDFAADAKAAGLKADEVRRIIDHLARRPDAGDVIPASGGAQGSVPRARQRQERRLSGDHVLHRSEVARVPLTVFGKGEKIDLTQAERNELRKELAGMAEDYRKGVRLYVRSR